MSSVLCCCSSGMSDCAMTGYIGLSVDTEIVCQRGCTSLECTLYASIKPVKD